MPGSRDQGVLSYARFASPSSSLISPAVSGRGWVKPCFWYDRKLLADLSCCAWESLKVFLQEVVPEKEPIPGAVIAI